MKHTLFSSLLLLLLGASLAATEPPSELPKNIRTLRPEALLQKTLPDGRTLTLESLGRPLPGKSSKVEFVSVMPDGEKIAWAVSRATLEHFLLGYGEKSGLHRLDLTQYFGPHSYKPTFAFHRDSIYILAGNRGPALIRYHIPTRTAKVLRKYDIPYYYLGLARDTGGRIYWSTYPQTEVIGVDPETDQVFSLGRMTEEPNQSYALHPAVDDAGTLYVPVGMKRPELYACDLKTGVRKQILTQEEIQLLKDKNRSMIRVLLRDGRVYADLAGRVMRCTPDGLVPAPGVRFDRDVITANARHSSCDFGNGRTALRFTENGLVVARDDGEELIPIAGLPVVGHELYALGAVRDGVLFGSGIFPANTFGLNLKTLQARDFGMISGGGVQNYDLGAAPQGVLLASYVGGYLDLLDPERPVQKGVNPRRIGDMKQWQQERPFRLTPGEPGIFYTGTMPAKNLHGGAIVRIDLNSGWVHAWRNLIPDQSIMEVIPVPGDDFTLLGLSNINGGTGTKPLAETAELFLFTPVTGKVIWHDAPLPDVELYQGAARTREGRIMFLARHRDGRYDWCLWDPAQRKILRRVPLSGSNRLWGYTAREADADGKLYFIVQGTAYEYTPGHSEPVKLLEHPSLRTTGYITLAPDGNLYFFDECRLMRICFSQPSRQEL